MIISAVVCTLLSMAAKAQDSTSKFQLMAWPYMNADVGVSFAITGQYKLNNRLYVNASGKYHQNPMLIPKMNNELFHHRFRANTLAAQIGGSAGLSYTIPWKYKFIQPFAYYDLSVFHMDTRSRYDIVDSVAANGNTLIRVVNVEYKNLWTFENGIGIGATASLIGRLHMIVRFGVSANIITGLPKTVYNKGIHISPSLQNAIGLQYNF